MAQQTFGYEDEDACISRHHDPERILSEFAHSRDVVFPVGANRTEKENRRTVRALFKEAYEIHHGCAPSCSASRYLLGIYVQEYLETGLLPYCLVRVWYGAQEGETYVREEHERAVRIPFINR